MLLHGNFRECPLVDLLAMLASKGETGRLDVNLETQTAQLYLVEGKPVDCCVGFLQGEQALDSLLSSTEGSFRFASGVAPPNVMFRKGKIPDLLTLNANEDPAALSAEIVAATDSVTNNSDARLKSMSIVLVLAIIAGAVGLTIGSVIANIQHKSAAAFNDISSHSQASTSTQQIQPTATPAKKAVTNLSSKAKPAPTSLSPTAERQKESEGSAKSDLNDSAKTNKRNAEVLSIPVVLRIEGGRVVEAYAAEPQPGREAYEATAIRLARQRRFNVKSGTETVYLTISKQ